MSNLDEKDIIKPINITLPSQFQFGEVRPKLGVKDIPVPLALGPLDAFSGAWKGNGFNTIFRPNNIITPTILDNGKPANGDNVLQLNLTSETLNFMQTLTDVPNRGMVQADVSLNGVSYLQQVTDITKNLIDPKAPVSGIHVEPGLWMFVPTTTNPAEGPTIVRMASIPHGTTVMAQGTSTSFNGPPTIPKVDITPSFLGGGTNRFGSQTAAAQGTPRIPQDLTAYINQNLITQAILDDPNTLLRNHISNQKIINTTQISINTNPTAPLFGGGTDNIAFLWANPTVMANPKAPTARPNAQSFQMSATFWIETVQVTIPIPIFKPGQPPILFKGEVKVPGQPAPTFSVNPPMEIKIPRQISFTFKQIQYSQLVLLNFNGLLWPHVSVATLVPAESIPVPPSAWA